LPPLFLNILIPKIGQTSGIGTSSTVILNGRDFFFARCRARDSNRLMGLCPITTDVELAVEREAELEKLTRLADRVNDRLPDFFSDIRPSRVLEFVMDVSDLSPVRSKHQSFRFKIPVRQDSSLLNRDRATGLEECVEGGVLGPDGELTSVDTNEITPLFCKRLNSCNKSRQSVNPLFERITE
jgi:hypothetical protein